MTRKDTTMTTTMATNYPVSAFPLRRRKKRNTVRVLIVVLLSLVSVASLGMWIRPTTPRLNNVYGFPSHVHAGWHPQDRSERFPSIEERIKRYMHIWYLPNCNSEKFKYERVSNKNYTEITVQSAIKAQPIHFVGIAKINSPVVAEKELMLDCRRTDGQVKEHLRKLGKPRPTERLVENRGATITYCIDSFEVVKQLPPEVPLLSEFGDRLVETHGIPMIAKWRPVLSKDEVERVAAPAPSCHPLVERPEVNIDSLPEFSYRHFPNSVRPPIIWQMVTARHWWPVKNSPKHDIPWRDKLNKAIWRGVFTGVGNEGASNIEKPVKTKDVETCTANQRCNFVYQHANSQLIDARLTGTLGYVPPKIGSVDLVDKKDLSMGELQKYKILINLEGNDVSSGLKWQMYSRSVILMPPPTANSWALEELLEAWVHYVPIEQDGSDAEEKVRWILDNDEKAEQIAERSTLWMYDFLYHPDAGKDNEKVKKEILKRYSQFWK